MSIDEVMKFVERVSHYDPARPQDLSRLRAVIKQHVAEEVEREREECAKVCGAQKIKAASSQYAVSATVSAYNAPIDRCLAAIRARAEKETSNER